LPTLTEGEYIDLVDYTGRQVYPGKRGVIKESESKALDKPYAPIIFETKPIKS